MVSSKDLLGQISGGRVLDVATGSGGFIHFLLDDNEIVSVCMSVFASQERMEIDVQTAEDYRRRRVRRAHSRRIHQGLPQRGKQPNWECFWDDQPSVALAGKLGFCALPDFPVYYWQE